MKTTKTVFLLAGAVATGLVLGACRENEQGRPLAYKKGQYAGNPDTAISEDARRSIMNRVQHQSGLDSASGGTSGISGVSPSADVRPPAPRK
jgi:hypothetical protein